MSFFNKIKQGLGIGTMEAKLSIPVQIAGSSGQLEGDFVLTAKSDQQIKEVKVKLEMVNSWEEAKTRRDSNGNTENYTSYETRSTEMGNFTDNAPFAMKANEVKTIHFSIPFQPIINTPPSADTSFKVGAVSVVLNAFSNRRNERTEYKVEGKVDLKDVVLDPKDSKSIILM